MLRLCTSNVVCKGDPEFTKYIIARNHNDILTVAWWCSVCECDCARSCEDEHESIMINCYEAVFIIYHFEGPHLMNPGDNFGHVGENLGLWRRDKEFKKWFRSCNNRYNVLGYLYQRSTMFIEQTASYAFLCMYKGMKTGRDVARMIAREVAQMYLEDYRWLDDESWTRYYERDIFIQRLQSRIMKWPAT